MEFLLIGAALYVVMAFCVAVLAGRFVAAGERLPTEGQIDPSSAQRSSL